MLHVIQYNFASIVCCLSLFYYRENKLNIVGLRFALKNYDRWRLVAGQTSAPAVGHNVNYSKFQAVDVHCPSSTSEEIYYVFTFQICCLQKVCKF